MKEIQSISFIGSGNVATNLANAFYAKGIIINQIYSPTEKHAKNLAELVNAEAIYDISLLKNTADLYIMAVKDDFLLNVLDKIPFNDVTIVHTSGSIQSNLLSKHTINFGCIYPLQTLNKTKLIDPRKINFFLEANSDNLVVQLKNLVLKISPLVHFLDSERREKLHIAAIGVNNFTHFILAKSKKYCQDNDLDFMYLKDLLDQTFQQIEKIENPIELQTGPAKRGDVDIIKHHVEILEKNPDYKIIYQTINQLILTEFHGEKYKL